MNPFEVLGVAEGASLAETHAAWRRLAAVYAPARHADGPPDVQAEAARKLAEVNAAYLATQEHVAQSAHRGASLEPKAGGKARRRVVSIVGGVLVVCVAASVAVFVVTRGDGHGTTQHFPATVEAAFTSACEATASGDSATGANDSGGYCGCVLRHVEADYELSDFRAAERDYATTGVLPDKMVAASKACNENPVNDNLNNVGDKLSSAGS